MRKNTLNFLVDLGTLLAILLMIATGLILKYSLPAGSGSRGLMLWDLGRHDWGNIHFWVSVGLGVLLIAHIILHWPWVCGTIRRLTHRPTRHHGRPAAGFLNITCVMFLLVVIGCSVGFVMLANSNISVSTESAKEHAQEHTQARQVDPGIGRNRVNNQSVEHREEQPFSIRGSMTLVEVELETDVTVATLITLLNLPDDTAPDTHLGRVCRDQGLDMATARSLITDHALTK